MAVQSQPPLDPSHLKVRIVTLGLGQWRIAKRLPVSLMWLRLAAILEGKLKTNLMLGLVVSPELAATRTTLGKTRPLEAVTRGGRNSKPVLGLELG